MASHHQSVTVMQPDDARAGHFSQWRKRMNNARGNAFLLKAGDGESYATVAGLKTETLVINGEAVQDAKAVGWRELLAGAGTRSVNIAAHGIFTGSAAERQIKSSALSGALEPYELSFESGDRLRGRFMVTRLEYTGDYNGERNYRVALQSSGEVASL